MITVDVPGLVACDFASCPPGPHSNRFLVLVADKVADLSIGGGSVEMTPAEAWAFYDACLGRANLFMTTDGMLDTCVALTLCATEMLGRLV